MNAGDFVWRPPALIHGWPSNWRSSITSRGSIVSELSVVGVPQSPEDKRENITRDAAVLLITSFRFPPDETTEGLTGALDDRTPVLAGVPA